MKKLLALLLVLFMLAGCGGSADKSGDDASSVKEATIQVPADIMSMDPYIATDGQSFSAQNLCFAGLTQLDADGNPVADLAKTWDVSEDGCVYTFHLADTYWSNGDKVTANDFVEGWKKSSDLNYNADYYWLFDTANVVGSLWSEEGGTADDLGVKAIDENTFEVTLSQPTGFFLQITAFPTTFPMNKAFVDSCGDQYALAQDKLIACGPYVMTEWNQGYGYTFELNEKYYDYENYVGKYADKVNFRIVADTQSALMDYESGNLDYVSLNGSQVKANSDKEGFAERLGSYNFYLILNINYVASDGNKAISNINTRKAMSYAIDREDVVNTLNDGSVAAAGIVPYKLAANPETGADFRDDSGNYLEYDADKAKEYYAKACEELGVDNISIDLMYSSDQGDPEITAATRIASQLEEVGFTVTLNPQPKKSRLNVYQHVDKDTMTADFEVSLTRWGPDYGDPQTYMDLFISENTSNNNGGYNSEAYDTAIANAEAAGTSAIDRWNYFIEAEKVLMDDLGVIPVYQNGGACLINPAISGIEFHSASVDVFRHIVVNK